MKNEYQKRIYELLEKYVNEIKEKAERLEQAKTFKILYEELCPLLKDIEHIEDNKLVISFIISTIYKDDIYLNKFFSLIPNLKTLKENRKELKELENQIFYDGKTNEQEIDSLDSQLKRSKNLIFTAKRTRYNLKYYLPITQYKYDIDNIKTILSYYETMGEISNKELLLLVNEIELYNRRIVTENANQYQQAYFDDLYNEVPRILSTGYQKHDEVEVLDERKPTLDKFVKEILSYIEALESKAIAENIEKYQNYIEDNEYNYIVIKLLDHYQEELLTLQEMLCDKEIFLRRRDRLEVIKKYYEKLNLYLLLLNYYDEINKYEDTDEVEEETKEVVETNNNQRNLIYATAPNNPLKVRLIEDMDELPKSYYAKIEKMLDDFKHRRRDTSLIKPLKKRASGKLCRELKDDQVRIVYKQIKDDTFIVTGVFIKKDNNDSKTYNKIKNRAIPKIDTDELLERHLELAKQIETSIREKVKKEGQKWSR